MSVKQYHLFRGTISGFAELKHIWVFHRFSHTLENSLHDTHPLTKYMHAVKISKSLSLFSSLCDWLCSSHQCNDCVVVRSRTVIIVWAQWGACKVAANFTFIRVYYKWCCVLIIGWFGCVTSVSCLPPCAQRSFLLSLSSDSFVWFVLLSLIFSVCAARLLL